MKRFAKQLLALLLVLGLLLPQLPAQTFADSLIIYDAATVPCFQRSPQQVASHWLLAKEVGASYVDGRASSYYARPASTKNPYDQGKLTQDTLDAMGAMVDYLRWLSGAQPLQTKLSNDDSLQCAALVRNFQFAHFVDDSSKPSDMDQSLWDAGKNVWHNILAYNYTPRGAIIGWCNEGYRLSQQQWDTVGHRFCLLEQDVSALGLGYSGSVAIGVMEAYNNTTQAPFTAFPAPGPMPLELLSASESAWSLEPNHELLQVSDPSKLKVTVKNTASGASYDCTLANGKLQYNNMWIDDISFVQPDPGSNSYADGSVYQVVVTGLLDRSTGKAAELRYQVAFFSLSNYPNICYDVALDVGSGGTAKLSTNSAAQGATVTITPSPSNGYKVKSVTWKAEGGTATDITQSCKFTMPKSNVTVSVRFESAPLHTLKLEAGPNGTASLSLSAASVGQEIVVSPEPDANYDTAKITWKVDGGKAVEITNTKKFVMPDADVSVNVSFQLHNPFVDVPANAWFYPHVIWAYYHDPRITDGTDPTHFSPDKTVTRAEVMTFFWAANGKPEPSTTQSPFKDVKKKHWALKPILWATENEITSGTGNNRFSPGRDCSRSEVLQFLYASMGKPSYTISNPYSDVKNKHWYKNGAIWAYEMGIEQGENGRFNATTPTTRAFVVTYLHRYFDAIAQP